MELLVNQEGTLESWREIMLGERQKGALGWGGFITLPQVMVMGLILLQHPGNILILSQPPEEAGVFLLARWSSTFLAL